jgi:protein ImuA
VAPRFSPAPAIPPAPQPSAGAGRERARASFAGAAREPPEAGETSSPAAWGFGLAAIDRALPRGGLEPAGLHELKPAGPGDEAAAVTLALLLAARLGPTPSASLVWVEPVHRAREAGTPYGPGLAYLGLDPAAVLLVETGTAAETLWAIEEALEARAASAVVGFARALEATPQRRLVLAAARGATPCLLVTPHAGPGLAAAHTRWRIERLGSAERARGPGPPASAGLLSPPGPPRFAIALERCRGAIAAASQDFSLEGRALAVELDDASYRFRLSSPLADRAEAPRQARQRAG